HNADADAQALADGEVDGNTRFNLESWRIRRFGGSSHHWAGLCQPLRACDFEVRDWFPESGWPFGLTDLMPYYRLAQTRLELPRFAYDSLALESADRAFSAPGFQTDFYQFSPPTRYSTRYRDALAASADATVMLDATATELVLESGHDRISHVEVRSLSGASFRVEAERTVLATGGIDNARLLLASRAQRPDGVANGAGLVGRYFMEHPHLYEGPVWLWPESLDRSVYSLTEGLFETEAGEPIRSRVIGLFGLTDAVRNEEALFDFSADPSRLMDGRGTGGLERDAVAALLRGAGDAQQLTLRAEQPPRAENRVTLSDDRDALGVPRARLTWNVSDDDRRNLLRSVQRLGAALGAAGAGRLFIEQEGEGIAGRVRPAGHHMGTTRYGRDATDGVVDEDGRCFEVPNLYIAGSSVFRTGGRANPTLTLVALAERLADHLRGRAYLTEAP
ncbi:MAG: GMC oxidoreductase, partial [Sandaracinaceae bacterium]